MDSGGLKETKMESRMVFQMNLVQHEVLARMALEVSLKSRLSGEKTLEAGCLESVLTQLEDARCFYEGVAAMIEDARRRLIAAEQVA
jgi:hypothetical protein